ncbi:hypothetical protein [Runella slithyformis]|uniref:Uncharacterized protein n=1 Tax=Runella slithyformis (strain ATCC 29530 / DSM 19594 / LMG 11500 / NCIMB 11436 / LSU 4) TaxID=761193 RepID=A0A7U3ZJK3_RUNSL|nr:hypothetical protein [Runella slithyformis]AEI48422.1 hypothetical protein Runsl_2006 [Runella slithyformis DSM 19594]
MPSRYAVCPITGLEVVLCKPLDDFKGIRFVNPSISEHLLICISETILQNNEIREDLVKNREKFVKNLKMVARIRRETVISTGNWWLFVK